MKKLEGVEDTIFIPLEARIYVSENFPEYFYDEKSLELKNNLPENKIQEKSSQYSLIASVARYYNMDKMVKKFISKYENSNIIYLGAGLETAYYRINNETAQFYEVDLPEVINMRKELLKEYSNEKFIADDLFNLNWTKEINTELPSLLIVSGVFQYFKEEKIKELIKNLQSIFTNAEMIFDATDESGIKYANKYVKRTGNKDAMMYFYVNDSQIFASNTNTTLIEEKTFYVDARKILKGKVGLYTRIAMWVVDKRKKALIVHIQL